MGSALISICCFNSRTRLRSSTSASCSKRFSPGAAATPGLKRFEQDADVELRKRVLELKQHIEIKAEPMVQSAVARLIAKTRPAGAADVLFAYIPYAVDAD